MTPPPVQRPRPPLVIAALGPAMMRHVARYADTWNCYGGFGVTAAEAFTATASANARLDDYCAEIGRDPAVVRRSLLVYKYAGNPFASVDAFTDFIGPYLELGMDEFILYYPPQPSPDQSEADQVRVFDRVATDVLPRLRAGQPP